MWERQATRLQALFTPTERHSPIPPVPRLNPLISDLRMAHAVGRLREGRLVFSRSRLCWLLPIRLRLDMGKTGLLI